MAVLRARSVLLRPVFQDPQGDEAAMWRCPEHGVDLELSHSAARTMAIGFRAWEPTTPSTAPGGVRHEIDASFVSSRASSPSTRRLRPWRWAARPSAPPACSWAGPRRCGRRSGGRPRERVDELMSNAVARRVPIRHRQPRVRQAARSGAVRAVDLDRLPAAPDGRGRPAPAAGPRPPTRGPGLGADDPAGNLEAVRLPSASAARTRLQGAARSPAGRSGPPWNVAERPPCPGRQRPLELLDALQSDQELGHRVRGVAWSKNGDTRPSR